MRKRWDAVSINARSTQKSERPNSPSVLPHPTSQIIVRIDKGVPDAPSGRAITSSLARGKEDAEMETRKRPRALESSSQRTCQKHPIVNRECLACLDD